MCSLVCDNVREGVAKYSGAAQQEGILNNEIKNKLRHTDNEI